MRKFNQLWKDFLKDPFLFFDELDLTFLRIQWNIFRRPKKLRQVIFFFSILLTMIWFVLGWDSGTGMIEYPILSLPDLISGKISIPEWQGLFSEYYGKTMHFSSFVIYGLLYVGISKYYDEIGIKNSKNVAFTVPVVFLSIAIFEYFWIYSFSHFQNQGWVSTWKWPQIRILIQNLLFTAVGIIGLLNVYAWDYKLRFNWRTLLIFAITIGSCIFWIYYPFQIDRFSVELTTGTWTNTDRFPQTLYTIDFDPLDDVCSGEWFYYQNDLLHGVNVAVKIIMTYFIYYIFKIIPQETGFEEEPRGVLIPEKIGA